MRLINRLKQGLTTESAVAAVGSSASRMMMVWVCLGLSVGHLLLQVVAEVVVLGGPGLADGTEVLAVGGTDLRPTLNQHPAHVVVAPRSRQVQSTVPTVVARIHRRVAAAKTTHITSHMHAR